jgi:GT2 family glycosyltransferase
MKKMTHKVAVHIVTHNSADTIPSCLKALQKQSFRNIVICIIDNNSTDNTAQIANKFAPDVLVKNTQNIGYAAAHNQALRYTKSEYVLTLNPDVLLGDRFIERMVGSIDGSPARVGSAAGLLYRVNSLSEISQQIDGAGLYMRRNRRQLLRHEGKYADTLVWKQEVIFGPDGAAAFYRREMLEDINLGDGVFDEDFFMHKEDVDVCWRAQLRGWSSLFVPDAQARHIRTFRAGQRKHIDSSMRMMAVRNRYYLMIKNELAMLFLRDFPLIALYDFGIFLYLLLKERSSLVAYAQVIQALQRLVQKRSRIQAHVVVGLFDMAHWFQRGRP